jgi:hypothetical protein
MLSCGLRRPRMRRSLRRARIRNRPRQCGGFEVTRMRPRVFNGLALMVSLSNHELVAVRRAHREAMGNIVFQQPAS